MKRAMIVLAAALAVGCASSDHKQEDHEHAKDTRHEQIAVDKAPAAVRDGFKRDFPDATITKVEKETYANGTVHYEFYYIGSDGKTREVEYAADGEKLDEH
jgi:hypothetical protein